MCGQPKLLLSVLLGQQESNSVDCGLFTIMYDGSLVYGKYPHYVIYDTSSFSSNFDHRLENGKMKPCPKQTINIARP